jgi:type I restriction enzyme, S subunit
MSDGSAHTEPKAWTRRRLRFDARINPVKSELDLPEDTEVSFVPMDAVGELGGLRLDQIRELAEVYNGYTYFANGDICVAKITPCFENGKGALAEDLVNGVAFGTTELHVLRPSAQLDPRFLFYLTVAHDFRSHGESEMLGAGGQKRVPENFLKNWTPPLPRIEVQQRIVRFLDEKTARIDALIANKQALLERLAEKRQALITHAVTKGLNPDAPMKASGVDWLGEVPTHWTVAALGYRYEVQLGRMLNADRSDGDNLKPYLRVFDVQWGQINTADLPLMDFPVEAQKRYRLNEGDLLVNEGGSFVGRSAIWRSQLEECYYQKALHRLRPLDKDSDTTSFLYFVMEAATRNLLFEGGGNQTTIDHLTAEQLRRYRFVFPPLNEQVAISSGLIEQLKTLENCASKGDHALTQLNEYRSSLITAAVTGQLPELNG